MKRVGITDAGAAETVRGTGGRWINIETAADIEVSSEDELFPIEQAFGETASLGWRAGTTGRQLIRLLFHEPQQIGLIRLRFVERAAERSQEVALRVRQDGEPALRELLRQQFTFSPGGSTEELENFAVDLRGVVALKLEIDPDRVNASVRSEVYATLASMRLGGGV